MRELVYISDDDWKELLSQYEKEFGVNNLKYSTEYKGFKLGWKFCDHIRKRKYEKSTLEQQKELREFWDCFPDEFWKIKRKRIGVKYEQHKV